uniref:Non-structural protein P8 n=1 Tax=Bluetongue virus 3 TaxID=36423 RepID=A0A7S6NI74_BTV|nr:non-structural proteins-3 and -3A [Bluetongue virus 3]QOL11097.1 non-structural proteins-3 and -3A [Bluetongue virus 3]
MLSGLIQRFEEEKMKHNQERVEELSLVRVDDTISQPPRYAPSAPVPSSMPTVALEILDKAMSNTTGATQTQKAEKAAFASYAEAFRDDVRLRQIKRHVNEQILPKLKSDLGGLKKKRAIIHMTLLVAAVVALLTSVCTLSSDMSVAFKLNGTSAEIPQWFKSLNPMLGVVNLGATFIMMVCAKSERGLNQQIDMIKKEVMKKQSYNDAVRMSFTEFSSVPLDGFELPLT